MKRKEEQSDGEGGEGIYQGGEQRHNGDQATREAHQIEDEVPHEQNR